MTVWNPGEYSDLRDEWASQEDEIIAVEEAMTRTLVEVLLTVADRIEDDFNHASESLPHWINYAPAQRGRGPSGTGVPWLEVAEYTAASNLIAGLFGAGHEISFPGLPAGGDVRFATAVEFVHIDIKAAGPNDLDDEAVVPPFQVSGGAELSDASGVKNEVLTVHGHRADSEFMPALPPFYFTRGEVRLTLTYFLKLNYLVDEYGSQPFRDMELACLPNGLLLFDGPRYGDIRGLFTPGKDDRSVDLSRRRVRVKFDALGAIAQWRAVKIGRSTDGWRAIPRITHVS